jgi:hypothetical protein
MRLLGILNFAKRKLLYEIRKFFQKTFTHTAKKYSDLFAEAPDFPSSAGSPHQLLSLTALGATQTLSRLIDLGSINPLRPITQQELQDTVNTQGLNEEALSLKGLFDGYGSDKGSSHGYFALYALLLSNISESQVARILEIGLGTNNTGVPSHMGPGGIPGASLRAWRDLSPTNQVVGVDIDADILFQEERISTFKIDQLDASSWHSLPRGVVEEGFDLIIDDGLHSPIANLNTVIATLPLLKAGGYLVIEDVASRALPVWDLASHLMGISYQVQVYQFSRAFCVVISRNPEIPSI